MGIEEMTDEEKLEKENNEKKRTWTIIGFTTFGLTALAHGTGAVPPFGVVDWFSGILLIVSIFKSS